MIIEFPGEKVSPPEVVVVDFITQIQSEQCTGSTQAAFGALVNSTDYKIPPIVHGLLESANDLPLGCVQVEELGDGVPRLTIHRNFPRAVQILFQVEPEVATKFTAVYVRAFDIVYDAISLARRRRRAIPSIFEGSFNPALWLEQSRPSSAIPSRAAGLVAIEASGLSTPQLAKPRRLPAHLAGIYNPLPAVANEAGSVTGFAALLDILRSHTRSRL